MDNKCFFLFCSLLIISTDLAILLNIPFLRQILGFLFLTILPGLLILRILKLNKIGFTEKFVLSVGVSISFLMFFGLLINNLSLSLGYETPLSTISLLTLFNIAFIVLAIKTFGKSFIKTIFREKKLVNPKISSKLGFCKKCLPNINLNTSGKAFLIVPILFPALCIFGMHIMNTTDNNIILMLLLFLIPIYVAFISVFNHKFSKRLYPAVIFLISISLLLLLSLRSNHLIGGDIHREYYLFQITFDNLHWRVLRLSYASAILDACLSVSLLPTIYQSILNIPSEYLFKILYSLSFSISPLVVYVLSKKYIGDFYGFLASCFFMFQINFLYKAECPRICIAVLFFTLALMTLFNDEIEPLKKRLLFIVFMASCVVSHYSTAYVFFFIMLGSFMAMEVLSKKYTVKKVMSPTIVLLFFGFIFFWYSQVTETAFNSGVSFVEKTFLELNNFFIAESRAASITQLGGQELKYPILSRINFVLTWSTFILIGIGVLTMIMRYKEMIDISNVKVKKPDFLKTKFEMGYLAIVLMCAGLLVISVALPYVSKGYDIQRVYALATVILSVCFIIGGITLSKNLSLGKKALLKKHFFRRKSSTKKSHYLRKGGRENDSEVRAYFIILVILIPYFLFYSGVVHQLFGIGDSIILNSEGKQYDYIYVYDSESFGAKWLIRNAEKNIIINTIMFGEYLLISQGKVVSSQIDNCLSSFINHKKVEGYIYLYYDNVVEGKLRNWPPYYNITDYSDMFVGTNKIYGNGCSEVYKT